jgi:hypothetical protein
MPPGEPIYAIDCRCGAILRGRRLAESQILPCTACGQPIFVLPFSPLPPELLGSLANGTTPEFAALKPSAPLRFWIGPAVGAILALAVVSAVVASIVSKYRTGPVGEFRLSSRAAGEQWKQRVDAAQAAIGEGAYRIANNELGSAEALLNQFPDVADREALRGFRRTRRQVAVLADLLPESVEEIMRHALGQSDPEWQAVFRDRYAGRSVILDTRVFRDHSGQFHVDYRLDVAGLSGSWDLQGLKLLERLPLQQPQRLFFAMRLADVSRVSRNGWAVRPQPDSGVLLTDESLLSGLSIAVDPELRQVLHRQAKWEHDDK